MEFEIGMKFSCEQNLPGAKWISPVSLDIGFNAHVRLKLIAGADFISVIMMTRYYVNTTQNEMPTRAHQNIGLFWNAAEMKRHVNRTCFHTGLKSHTDSSAFRLSREHALCFNRTFRNVIFVCHLKTKRFTIIFLWIC